MAGLQDPTSHKGSKGVARGHGGLQTVQRGLMRGGRYRYLWHSDVRGLHKNHDTIACIFQSPSPRVLTAGHQDLCCHVCVLLMHEG